MKIWFLTVDHKHLGDIALLVGIIYCAIFICYISCIQLASILPKGSTAVYVFGSAFGMVWFFSWLSGFLAMPMAVLSGLWGVFQKEQKTFVSIIAVLLNVMVSYIYLLASPGF